MRRLLLNVVLGFAACASVSQGQVPPSTAAAQMPDASTAPGDPAAARQAPAGSGPGGRGGAIAAPPVPSGAVDRGAEADFNAARARFDAGDQVGARAALEGFAAAHPNHPSRVQADLLLARLALTRGDAAGAKKILDPIAAAAPDADAGTAAAATGARYYLGLAESRLGNAARARTLLAPFMPKGGADASATSDAAIELQGAMAEATSALDPVAGLELWETYARLGREHEKAWARQRATDTAARIPPENAWRAYGAAPPGGLTRAVLGSRAAGYLRGRGDAAGAAFIETETNTARHSLGFDAGARVGPGDPTRIGLALPLSGKFQVVGEAALRAAMLAGAAPTGAAAGAPPPAQLIVRDTATDSDRAVRGVTELTRAEAVIGIVGVASAKTGTPAVAQASQDGIAVLALEDTAPGALTTAFQIVHAPEARATALARQALKAGVHKFAMVGPDSASGKRLREAFRKAVTEGGGSIAAETSYVAGATSFSGAIAPLKKVSVEAVFVPESADRLALIAPALAVADLWPQPWTKARGAAKREKDQPRPVLLLSTANELSRKLLDSAGRYVQGALLCPGFFADEADARSRGFVEAYRAAYGQEPHATEAYAYDAVATLRAVTGRGARTRADVVKALSAPGSPAMLQGLTGDLAFGPDHGRTDSPLVYMVAGDDIRLAK